MRSTIALGAAFVAATASVTLVVNGLATSQLPGRLFDTPRAAAQGLVPFDDCEELRQWYVEEALPHVGPWGFDGGWLYGGDWGPGVVTDTLSAAGAPTRDVTELSVESSETGTNVQEAGVDEPDRAKTAGSLVVHLRGNRLVVTDAGGGEPRELSTLRLPRGLVSPELLVSGDTVLVLGTTTPFWGGPVPLGGIIEDDVIRPVAPMTEDSRLLEVSLADPTDPRVESDQTLGGRIVSARQYDGTVRLVLRTGYPTLDFVQPDRERSEREAERANRQIVRDSDISDWLPTARLGDGDWEPLVDCADVRHPRTGAGFGTVSLLTFDAEDPTERDATAVTAEGETVYSSADRLYLATWAGETATQVHAFSLDGTTTSYVASGKVDGTLKDRWSMDEHAGVLRLAVAHGPGWSPTENGITTLREEGDRLVVVGSVRGLGPEEEIKSVRWFDDLAVVVTFQQTDPLYTVDLSDPARPRTLGQLKIPGFSEYLHPIGDGLLLGVGQDASRTGQTRGAQASLFDLGDLTTPRRLATLGLGKDTQAAAGYDPRAFTWLADKGVALTSVSHAWSGRSSLVELRVGDDGTLTEVDRWRLPGWDGGQARALPLPDGSVAVVTGIVQLVEP